MVHQILHLKFKEIQLHTDMKLKQMIHIIFGIMEIRKFIILILIDKFGSNQTFPDGPGKKRSDGVPVQAAHRGHRDGSYERAHPYGRERE